MPLTKEEMKARWKAGNPDIDGDGAPTVQDAIIAGNFAREEAEQTGGSVDTESLINLGNYILSDSDDWAAARGSAFAGGDLPPVSYIHPMPSMPSISNVGAVPFSGSINWNAIPGGFQPLPQVAGGRKKLYQLSKFHGGMNQKSSPRDISDMECQQASNLTFSDIGRIKLLGDIKSTSSTIISSALGAAGSRPSPGYGLYIFKSGYSLAAPPVPGNYAISISQAGGSSNLIDDTTTPLTSALVISNTAADVAPVWYAAGSGLYACNANFEHTGHANDTRKALMLVYREDFHGGTDGQVLKGWVAGEALVTSPNVSDDGGTDKIQMVDATGGDGTRIEADNGAMTVFINPTGTGNWNGTYRFYVSALFDNGCETGMSYLGTDAFSNNTLAFNISVKYTAAYGGLSGDGRIHGVRIYFMDYTDNIQRERYLLAEVSFPDGIKSALETIFVPWDTDEAPVYDLADPIIFKSPPELSTYVALNGYYVTEVYDNENDNSMLPHDVRYRTATVGSNGSVFIGAYMFRGKLFADGMMYSMPGKPGVFPEYNVYDSPSSDGTPITALVSFKDKILQFKQNAMYVVNISNPTQFYTEASFRDCGIMNPCQAFATAFGVIFANQFGCFIYDGEKVISLTNGKFNQVDLELNEDTVVDAIDITAKNAADVPCVGYDSRTQSIIVLKTVGNDDAGGATGGTDAWVYSMATQSWSEAGSMIDNAINVRYTNFAISPNGYLCIQNGTEEPLKTYNAIGDSSGSYASSQTIEYTTKDLDFGLPSQTKKIFKIYVTYLGDGSGVTVTYGADGADPISAMTNAENSGATLTTAGTADHNIATFTLNSHPPNLNSIALKFAGTAVSDFEINDISILYRSRPIK